MSFTSEASAMKRAKEVLAMMETKGWKIRVHENMGWHWTLHNGPLNLHESSSGDSFFCLVSSEPKGSGGLAMWTDSEAYKHRSAKEPNACVERALRYAQAVLQDLFDNLKPAFKAYGLEIDPIS
jgi:hypothetical protein